MHIWLRSCSHKLSLRCYLPVQRNKAYIDLPHHNAIKPSFTPSYCCTFHNKHQTHMHTHTHIDRHTHTHSPGLSPILSNQCQLTVHLRRLLRGSNRKSNYLPYSDSLLWWKSSFRLLFFKDSRSYFHLGCVGSLPHISSPTPPISLEQAVKHQFQSLLFLLETIQQFLFPSSKPRASCSPINTTSQGEALNLTRDRSRW